MGVLDEEILTALSHLPEYPTCPKAMRWFGARRLMYLTGLVEQFVKDGSISREGFVFPVCGLMIRCPVRVHPLCPSGGLLEGRGLPPGCLGLPGTFHCAVPLHYVCQICKVQYAASFEGIKDPLIHIVTAKY